MDPRCLDLGEGAGAGVVTPPRRDRSRGRRGRPRGAVPVLDGWPPPGWSDGGRDDDGGGGGGGDGGGGRFDPWDGLPRPGTSELGMALALVCICTLFLIFLGGYLLLWKNAPEWPPPGAPRPPEGLWISTLVLVAASATLARALAAQRRRERAVLLRSLGASLVLGLAFLGVQAWLWRDLLARGLEPSTNGYGAIFYALTGLHGAHVVIGLGYAAKVLHGVAVDGRGAGVGAETPVRLCGVYWHTMGAIWIVLFAALYFLR